MLARDPDFERRCFSRIVPSIVGHARGLLERAAPTLTIHDQGVAAQTSIDRRDAAGWLAHLVLGTLEAPSALHPPLDFALLDGEEPAQHAKLRCVLQYFDRLGVGGDVPRGTLTIQRRVAASRASIEWLSDRAPLLPLTVDDRGSMEDTHAHLETDFANRWLGGGVLRRGSVQEEIRFVVAPELLVALIVSPVMRDDEAIWLSGSERFSKTTGYASSLQYAGPFDDPIERHADGTPASTIVALDAIDFAREREPASQFGEAAMLRELNKARAGWQRDEQEHGWPVVSGNWGCGVFGGDPPLKAVLQWIAASSEGRALRYCAFGDLRVGQLARFADRARAEIGTTGELWRRLLANVERGGSFLYDRLLDRG